MHRLSLTALMLLGAAAPAASRQQAPTATAPVAEEMTGRTDAEVVADLVEANHILAHEGVLDGFGHISARSRSNPKHFFMARSLAPALVTAADIMEFDENSRPVDQRGRQMYSERLIHGEILRARPDVWAVVHSHSPEVLPFTVSSAPFKAVVHTSGFLGADAAPVYDSRKDPAGDYTMLVTNAARGHAVAAALGDRTVVLLRGHGMAVTASNIRQVVLRAIYTQLNARIETEALRLGGVTFLDAREAQRHDPSDRPWEIWVRAAEAAKAER